MGEERGERNQRQRRRVGRRRRSLPPRLVSLQACPRMPRRLQQLHLSTSTPRFPRGALGWSRVGSSASCTPSCQLFASAASSFPWCWRIRLYPGMAAPALGRCASVGGMGVCVWGGLLLIMCTLGRAGLVVRAQDWTRERQVPQPPAGHIIPPCLRFPRSWRHEWLSCRPHWDLVGLRGSAV